MSTSPETPDPSRAQSESVTGGPGGAPRAGHGGHADRARSEDSARDGSRGGTDGGTTDPAGDGSRGVTDVGTTDPAGDGSRHGARDGSRILVACAIAIPVAIALMLLAFLTPSINSGAKGLPLTLSAPAASQDQVVAQLEAAAPGVFDVTAVDSASQVTSAVENRDAIGGIAASETGVDVVTASGAGSPYATILRNLASGLEAQIDARALAAAQAQGADAATLLQVQQQAASTTSVTVTDVAPLTSEDSAGVALSSLALPLVFGGEITGVLLSIVSKAPAWRRALTAVVVAALGALVAVLILNTWFGAIAGSFWLEWAGLALGISAISLAILGLHAAFGIPGIGLGIVAMLFVANPLSGIATGWQWLPSGWGTVGQMLPVGAAGTWLRSAAYFEGHGMSWTTWVLLAWIAAGLILLAAGTALRRRRTVTA